MTATTAPAAPATGLGGQLRDLLVLAVPLVGSNLATFAIHLTDVVLLGWYDVTALAGITLATSLWYLAMLLGSGFALAVMPLAALAAADGRLDELRRAARMGLWLSALYTLALTPLLLASGRLFLALGQDPAVAEAAGRYLAIAGWGLGPVLLIQLLRSVLAAIERPGIILWVTLGGVALNAGLGWVLIFGRLGAPALGIEGAAWAALWVQTAMALALALYAGLRLRDHGLVRRLWQADWAVFGRVFALGWPIGLTLLAEVGLFAGSAFMMGWVGTVELAAHGIAIQLASAAFMVHLGISQAATVRAGQAFGRGDRRMLAQGALAALLLSGGFALATSAAFLLAPRPLLGLFVDPLDPARPELLAVGAVLLALAALFQIFDGLQVVALGLLRGLQDTAWPMVLAALSYWGLGLPLAATLGFALGLDEAGIWLGLVAGLVAAAALLLLRFRRLAAARFAKVG